MGRLQCVDIHIPESEHETFWGHAVYENIVRILFQRGAPGITVFRAYEGLDANGHLQSLYSDYATSLPMILEIVMPQDTELTELLEKPLAGHPHCVTRCVGLDAKSISRLYMEAKTMSNTATLRIYMKEEDRYQGMPLYSALIIQGKKGHFLWVNVQSALEGFGPDRVIRKRRLFHLSSDAPVVVELTGTTDEVLKFAATHNSMICAASGPAIILESTLISGRV